MKVSFLGAVDGEVTGSCTHFNYERTNTQFLVDCGLFQGGWNPSKKNSKPFTFDPAEIKFVILTHAHLDHCGLIPRLYREGFDGEVICTTATAILSKIQLEDSVKFAEGLYHRSDVKKIKFRCVDEQPNFGLSRFIPIDQDLTVAFTRSAHVLGSVSVNLCWDKADGEKANIVMSGDIGGNTKGNPYGSLLAGAQTPFGHPQYVVLESTYGKNLREDEFSSFESRIEKLSQLVEENVVKKNKLLIIPAFSLQRSQEILFDLYYLLSREEGALKNATTSDKKLAQDKFYDGNGWPSFIQEEIEKLTKELPEEDRSRWENAFEPGQIENRVAWFIKEEANVSIEEVQSAIAQRRKPLSIEVRIDTPLAKKITKVFGQELCRRQIVNPDETLFRNRQLASRLGLQGESEVDSVIEKVFPVEATEEHEVRVGQHIIHYSKETSLPTKKQLQNQGMILITGSGMCEGGPVVEHLQTALPRDDVVILLTGYMARETVGNKLVSISKCQMDGRPITFSMLEVGGQQIPTTKILANIVEFGAYYSGHADCNTLLSFLSNGIGKPSKSSESTLMTVFLNHGDDSARAGLKNAIELHQKQKDGCRIGRVELPSSSSGCFDLDCGEWIKTVGKSSPDETLPMLLVEQRRTNELLEKLISLMEAEPASSQAQ